MYSVQCGFRAWHPYSPSVSPGRAHGRVSRSSRPFKQPPISTQSLSRPSVGTNEQEHSRPRMELEVRVGVWTFRPPAVLSLAAAGAWADVRDAYKYRVRAASFSPTPLPGDQFHDWGLLTLPAKVGALPCAPRLEREQDSSTSNEAPTLVHTASGASGRFEKVTYLCLG
ncbi:uncharacterized protein LY79DRAFT_584532 [Colletotrichum navitas]|uniref:Uncharacterized protein n=1 Tax=Colletotrichum navitas TaxID=681940 RepID=A0AAD8PMA8_9PEZI|nr:uncharacterized protein LY79DRAFT_584532 [Colletotrichum navitas]KAK1569753.1 hypothetical protein LY79DRAFT_584532 [Colletotrichum navitas]